MKTIRIAPFCLGALLVSFCLPLQASIGFTMRLVHDQTTVRDGFYAGRVFFYVDLGIQGAPLPVTQHVMTSPNSNYTLTVFTNGTYGTGSFLYDTLDQMLDEINGPWTFVLNQGDASAQTNRFTVTVTGINSNTLPKTTIFSPLDDSSTVSPNSAFTWVGPTNWTDLSVALLDLPDFTNVIFTTVPPTDTTWAGAPVIGIGENSFVVEYLNDGMANVSITTPTNVLTGTPLPDWTTNSHLLSRATSQFTVSAAINFHQLLAHFSFDDENSLGTDDSGHGNDMNFGGGWNGGGSEASTDTAAGAGAVLFTKDIPNSGGYMGWDPMPPGLLSNLARSFTISVWVKTSEVFGNDDDFAFNGAGIVAADVPGLFDDLVPLALTGTQAAFNTGSTSTDETLNSTDVEVTDGVYHHLVITRNQQTGEKRIYVDGQLNTSAGSTMNLLTEPRMLTIGALADASQTNPTIANYYNGYAGLLDDLQIYSGVLSVDDVAYLFGNPGLTIADSVAPVVTLFDAVVDGTDFKFSFVSLPGYEHTVFVGTDLFDPGSWPSVADIEGDGTIKTYSFPMDNESAQFVRIGTHPIAN